MAENSKIEWCDHTFNPWIGCQKVGPGCDHCYAESWAKRSGLVEWGPGTTRRLTSDVNWKKPLKWNREALATFGRPARVFCCSLADWADKDAPEGAREELFETIKATPNLQWLLLTKRIGNAHRMLPDDWVEGYPNVVIMATVVNQEEADRDIPKLLDVPARWRGLSIEPMLGPISLDAAVGYDAALGGFYSFGAKIDWVICGGESGAHARPMHPDWARSLRDQCQAAGVPFLFKQWGEWSAPLPWLRNRWDTHINANQTMVGISGRHGQFNLREPSTKMTRVGKKAAGRELDGREWNGFPSQQETS